MPAHRHQLGKSTLAANASPAKQQPRYLVQVVYPHRQQADDGLRGFCQVHVTVVIVCQPNLHACAHP
jgi:hypothetical protein